MDEAVDAAVTTALQPIPSVRTVPLVPPSVTAPTPLRSNVLKFPPLASTTVPLATFPCGESVSSSTSAALAASVTTVVTQLRHIPATVPSPLAKAHTIVRPIKVTIGPSTVVSLEMSLSSFRLQHSNSHTQNSTIQTLNYPKTQAFMKLNTWELVVVEQLSN